MRHVVEMTAAGAAGLLAVFFVDFLSLLYISWLGNKTITAGVGFATVVLFFTTSIHIGFMIAVGALAGKAIGSGDRQKAREIASAALSLMVIAGFFTSILILLALPYILPMLGATGQAEQVARQFLYIAVPSNALMALGMGMSGVLRAVGDARRAMLVTLVAGIVTIFIDPLLIFGFELGANGAAIATFISRIVFAVIGYWGAVHIHNMVARPTLAGLARHSRAVMAVAGPAILTNLASPVAMAFITRIMARFGDPAVAANAIIDRIVPLAFGGVFALTGAIGPILSQNWGAKLFARMDRALKDSLIFVTIYVALVWAILMLVRNGIVQMFGVAGQTADLLTFFTFISGPIWLFMGFLFVANATFNNLGYPLYATMFNWGRATLGTIPFALAGAHWGGPQGVFIGFLMGAMMFSVGAVLVAFRCVRQLAAQAPKP
ncbi:MAG: MATE family efflux transporter [Beijerinckiaceae bacterium]